MLFIEKLFWDLLILVLGTYVMVTLIAYVLASCWFGYWTWKHLRSNYALAPQIAVGATLIVLAQLLIIHNQLKAQGSEIEVRRNEEMREAEKKTVPEEAAKQEIDKSSPEYLEQKLRMWLEKAGYSTQHLEARGNDAFHITAKGNEASINIRLERGTDGMTVASLRTISGKERSAKFSKMSEVNIKRFSDMILLELLRLGIHHVVMVGKDNIMVELQNRFLLDETITRADLYEKLFLLQRGKAIVEIITNQFLQRRDS